MKWEPTSERTVDMEDTELLCLDIHKAKDNYGYVSAWLSVEMVDDKRFLRVYTNGSSTLIEIKDD